MFGVPAPNVAQASCLSPFGVEYSFRRGEFHETQTLTTKYTKDTKARIAESTIERTLHSDARIAGRWRNWINYCAAASVVGW